MIRINIWKRLFLLTMIDLGRNVSPPYVGSCMLIRCLVFSISCIGIILCTTLYQASGISHLCTALQRYICQCVVDISPTFVGFVVSLAWCSLSTCISAEFGSVGISSCQECMES